MKGPILGLVAGLCANVGAFQGNRIHLGSKKSHPHHVDPVGGTSSASTNRRLTISFMATDREDLAENATTEMEKNNDVPCTRYPPYMYKSKTRKRNKDVSIPGNRDISTNGALSEVDQSALKTRLLNERYYSNKEAFTRESLHDPPGLQDLVGSTEFSSGIETFWITPFARIVSFALAFFSFPYIIALLNQFVTIVPDRLSEIATNFGPGISILYGTFVSLTLSILYQRLKAIQESVVTEASLITVVLRNCLTIFRDHPAETLEAGQFVVDQIRTLVKCSRGVELMQIIYTDPYASLLELINDFEQRISTEEFSRKANIIAQSRDLIKELTVQRSIRLAEEARALPPTHFLVLNLLTSLILSSYCLNVLPSIDRIGEPPNESSVVFGILVTIYILFYNFADDLNNPFTGVYQVRRSTAASHLFEAKWLISNHPILRDRVDFGCQDDEENDRVTVKTPGVGETWFVKDEFYVTDNRNTNDIVELKKWLGLRKDDS